MSPITELPTPACNSIVDVEVENGDVTVEVKEEVKMLKLRQCPPLLITFISLWIYFATITITITIIIVIIVTPLHSFFTFLLFSLFTTAL